MGVEALPGGGTRFTVYLPQVPAPVATPPPPRPAPRVRPARLLLVEDDLLVRRVVQRILEAAGYVVEAVPSAPEALARIEAEGRLPELLVTDVAMPGTSGPALATALRRQGPLPVLFISGYAGHPALEAAAGLEDTELVTKPFTPEALLEAVARLLGG